MGLLLRSVYFSTGRARRKLQASGSMNLLWLGRAGGLLLSYLIPVSGQSTGSQISYEYSLFDYGSSCEENTSSIADGVCDISVNTAGCNFDGGDCCECTCYVDGAPCNPTGAAFDCRDPDAPTDCSPTATPTASPTATLTTSPTATPTAGPTATPTATATASPTSSFTYPACVGYVAHIKDGFCNETNNNADCGYDGGDCCSCTCEDGLEYPCGDEGGGFDCRDPGVSSLCAQIGSSCEGNTDYIQDLDCDSNLNNMECSYDGGDCCLCTCVDLVANSPTSAATGSGYETNAPAFVCGESGFNCLDPNVPADCALADVAPTPSPTSFYFPDCEGEADTLGDGVCDDANNSVACGWDGGDCCRCTCVNTDSQTCGEFDCQDPAASTDCETESSSESDSSGCQDPNVSDGQCNEETNTAVCGWDGGDCCECSCIDNIYSCGETGYNCLDPTQDCAPSASFTVSLSTREIVGAIIASVAGYCVLGAVISAALVFLRRKCRRRASNAPAGAAVLPQTAEMRAKRTENRSNQEEHGLDLEYKEENAAWS